MTITGVVRDYSGRLSALKIVTLLLLLLPGAMLAAQWITQDLGPRPITEVIHGTGLWAIRFLVIALAVTPARAVLDWSSVVMLRRMIGVAAACYAVAHLTLYCLDQKWDLLKVASEIALRFYLTVGFVTLLGLLALAITSTDGWQKSLGRNWKRLHKIIYVLVVMALFHYAVQSKADVSDAVFLAGLVTWLMLWRVAPRRWQAKLWPLPELALGAGLVAALLEAGWYGVRNGVNVLMVLSANLDVSFGPRPAVDVALAGLAVFAVAALRRLAKRMRRGREVPRGAVRRA
jgi:sulfoxide reductase heme-binding subunit YedZ